MFGGFSGTQRFGEVYILSLPGFVWTKATTDQANDGIARAFGSCVADGKRQMITVGGSNDFPNKPDPFPRGLGIFDMTELKWKDEYDAASAKYDSPQVIKSLYAEQWVLFKALDADELNAYREQESCEHPERRTHGASQNVSR